MRESEKESKREANPQSKSTIPSKIYETIVFYLLMKPNIVILNILAVLATTCFCERSMSALRRLKTWLKSSMTNEQLTGLALMHIHAQTHASRY